MTLRGVLEGPSFTVAVPFVFAAEPGNYETSIEGELTLRDGAKVDFCCPRPQCHHSLAAAWNDDLAEVKLLENGVEEVVVFSRVYGIFATFVYDRSSDVLQSFGEDHDRYADEFDRELNFFGSC